MTNEKLQKIVKQHKVNLDWFTHVNCFANQNYTFLFVTFASIENCGHSTSYVGRKEIKISISAICKREEFVEDYYTNGFEWLCETMTRK